MGHGGQTAHLLLGLLQGLSLSTESRVTQTGSARGALFALTKTAFFAAAIAGTAEFVVAAGGARAVNRRGGGPFGLAWTVITAHSQQFFGRNGGFGRHHGRSFGFDRGFGWDLVNGGIGWQFSSDHRVARGHDDRS
jgi:hypothetical protein